MDCVPCHGYGVDADKRSLMAAILAAVEHFGVGVLMYLKLL